MSSLGHISKVDRDFYEIDCPSYLKNLDIGCGNNKMPGYIGMDISKETQADVVHDWNVYPWPFENHTVFKIHSSHQVEHVENLQKFFEECYRILVPLGTMQIRAPYWSSMRAWQDFTHVREISENTFLYFNQEWLKANKLEHYGVQCNFKVLKTQFYFTSEWQTKSAEAQMFAKQHYIGCIDDIEIWLQKIKMNDV